MDKVLEYAKAVVTAAVVAIFGALAGVDWPAVLAASVVGSGAVARTRNRSPRK